MMNSETNVYWTKFILHATSLFWILYLAIFIHELGHAIAVIALGGTLHELVVTWDMCGRVLWTYENVPMDAIPRVITLVAVSGGIGAALFFLALTHKSRWFAMPTLFALLDGFGEAMYLADTRYVASFGVTLSTAIICLWLFWQFESREIDKRMVVRVERFGKRKRCVPEHIYEKAMRATEKCVDKLEEERKTEVLIYDAMENETV